MNFKKLAVSLLVFSLIFSSLPISINAQTAKDEVAPVPISDKPLREKEVGITIFGFTIPGLTLDLIAITIAKLALEQILRATTDWINNGFEGNPAYATDPLAFFGKIADNVAGEFINGSELGFLCSPFQTRIRLALQQYHTRGREFRCSLSDVVTNIEGFYDDFDEGGWDGWFAMTQNDMNNPYGAYLESRLELDSRVARAIGIQSTQLNWNGGFLSWSECTEWDTVFVTGDETPQKGECTKRGQVVTPGKVIESQLETVLGTGVKQLELADELDELVGALFTQLLKKLVFGVKGLFSDEGGSGGGGRGGGGGGVSVPPTNKSLNVYKYGSGVGVVTSIPAGINCGTLCAFNFPDATNIILTAKPDPGSKFSGWFGGVCPNATSVTCVLKMNADASVTAIFDRL